MILSNVEVHRALDEGRLRLDPEPLPRVPGVGKYCPYDTHSVDLSLAPEISIPRGGTFVYDVTQPGVLAEQIARNSDKRRIETDTPYKLERNTFILAMTRETVGLPIRDGSGGCLAARIEGKSSRARLGVLVHFTAPTVHPGWEGPLTLEIINLGPSPILLVPGMAIAQLIVDEVRGCPVRNPSQFQGQTAPEGGGRSAPPLRGRHGDLESSRRGSRRRPPRR
jgi:dCTP deaminase